MDKLLLKLLINIIAVFLTAYLLKGVRVKNFFIALITALLIALVNIIIKPIFTFLSIPMTILSLGFFLLIIDALVIMLIDKVLTGFKVRNFGWALIFSILLAIINALLIFLSL